MSSAKTLNLPCGICGLKPKTKADRQHHLREAHHLDEKGYVLAVRTIREVRAQINPFRSALSKFLNPK